MKKSNLRKIISCILIVAMILTNQSFFVFAESIDNVIENEEKVGENLLDIGNVYGEEVNSNDIEVSFDEESAEIINEKDINKQNENINDLVDDKKIDDEGIENSEVEGSFIDNKEEIYDEIETNDKNKNLDTNDEEIVEPESDEELNEEEKLEEEPEEDIEEKEFGEDNEKIDEGKKIEEVNEIENNTDNEESIEVNSDNENDITNDELEDFELEEKEDLDNEQVERSIEESKEDEKVDVSSIEEIETNEDNKDDFIKNDEIEKTQVESGEENTTYNMKKENNQVENVSEQKNETNLDENANDVKNEDLQIDNFNNGINNKENVKEEVVNIENDDIKATSSEIDYEEIATESEIEDIEDEENVATESEVVIEEIKVDVATESEVVEVKENKILAATISEVKDVVYDIDSTEYYGEEDLLTQFSYFGDVAYEEGDKIVLNEDINSDKTFYIKENTTLDLNNHKIIVATNSYAFIVFDSDFTIYDGKKIKTPRITHAKKPEIESIDENGNIIYVEDDDLEEIEQFVFNGSIENESKDYSTIKSFGGLLVFNGGKVIATSGNAAVNVENTNIKIDGGRIFGGDGDDRKGEKGENGGEGIKAIYHKNDYKIEYLNGIISGGNGGKGDGNIVAGRGYGLYINDGGIGQNITNMPHSGIDGEKGGGNGGNAIFVETDEIELDNIVIKNNYVKGGSGGKSFTKVKGPKILKSNPVPSYYDMRNYVDASGKERSLVTKIKDQSNADACWAFAGISAIESGMLKDNYDYLKEKGYEYEDLDLSELAFANYTFTHQPDPLGNAGNGDITLLGDYLSTGGSADFYVPYLSSGIGVLEDKYYIYSDEIKKYMKELDATDTKGYEKVFSYPNDLLTKAASLFASDEHKYDGIAMMKEAHTISRETYGARTGNVATDRANDIEYHKAMREYVKEYGTVQISMNVQSTAGQSFPSKVVEYTDQYGRKEEYTCCNMTVSPDSGGHALHVIGWDDNFPKDNFPDGKKPDTDGALLVKNSWGESSHFYWISYEYPETYDIGGEAQYMDFTYTTWEPKDKIDNVYYYDSGLYDKPWSKTTYKGLGTIYPIAHEKEKLKGVSMKMYYDATGTVKVYQTNTADVSGLDNANLLWSKNIGVGVFKEGVNYVEVDTPITINKSNGDYLVVSFEDVSNAPGYSCPLFYFELAEDYVQEGVGVFHSEPRGLAFAKKNTGVWERISDTVTTDPQIKNANTRFKIFTETIEEEVSPTVIDTLDVVIKQDGTNEVIVEKTIDICEDASFDRNDKMLPMIELARKVFDPYVQKTGQKIPSVDDATYKKIKAIYGGGSKDNLSIYRSLNDLESISINNVTKIEVYVDVKKISFYKTSSNLDYSFYVPSDTRYIDITYDMYQRYSKNYNSLVEENGVLYQRGDKIPIKHRTTENEIKLVYENVNSTNIGLIGFYHDYYLDDANTVYKQKYKLNSTYHNSIKTKTLNEVQKEQIKIWTSFYCDMTDTEIDGAGGFSYNSCRSGTENFNSMTKGNMTLEELVGQGGTYSSFLYAVSWEDGVTFKVDNSTNYWTVQIPSYISNYCVSAKDYMFLYEGYVSYELTGGSTATKYIYNDYNKSIPKGSSVVQVKESSAKKVVNLIVINDLYSNETYPTLYDLNIDKTIWTGMQDGLKQIGFKEVIEASTSYVVQKVKYGTIENTNVDSATLDKDVINEVLSNFGRKGVETIIPVSINSKLLYKTTVHFDNTKPSGATGTVSGSFEDMVVENNGVDTLTLPNKYYTLPGYTQIGWAKLINQTTAQFTKNNAYTAQTLGAPANISSYLCLYPVWKAAPITTVHFNNTKPSGTTGTVGGTINDITIKNDGITTQVLPNKYFIFAGYEQIGWAKTANQTTAQFTKNTAYKASSLGAPENTASTINLYPVWKNNGKATIHFNKVKPNGTTGTVGGAISDISVENNGSKSFVLPNSYFTFVGYEQVGWAKTINQTTKQFEKGKTYTTQTIGFTPYTTATINLYPVWKKILYQTTIQFEKVLPSGSSGTVSGTIGNISVINDGTTKVTLPNTYYAFTGYEQIGWAKLRNQTTAQFVKNGQYTANTLGAPTNTTSTIKLYPVWKKICQTTVRFNKLKPSGTTGTVEGTIDDLRVRNDGVTKLTLPNKYFTFTGWTQIGWATASGKTTAQFVKNGQYTSQTLGAKANITSTIYLYPVWQKNNFTTTIHFEKIQPASVSESVSGTINDITVKNDGITKVTLPNEYFEVEGFVQIGWAKTINKTSKEFSKNYSYTAKELGAPNNTSTIYLYPVWLKITPGEHYVNIKFAKIPPKDVTKTVSGEIDDIDILNNEVASVSLPNKYYTISDYTMSGWNVEKYASKAMYYKSKQYTLDDFDIPLYIDANITLYPVWTKNSNGTGGGGGGGGGGGLPKGNTAPKTNTNPNEVKNISYMGPASNLNMPTLYDAILTQNADGSKTVVSQTFGVLKGWQKIKNDLNENVYFITDDSKLYTGWMQDNMGNYYHLNTTTGVMDKGTQIINGIEYNFGDNGIFNGDKANIAASNQPIMEAYTGVWNYDPATSNWNYQIKDNRNQVKSVLANGLYNIENGTSQNYYMFDANGNVMTGFQQVNGKSYIFEANGANKGKLLFECTIVNGNIEYTTPTNVAAITPTMYGYKTGNDVLQEQTVSSLQNNNMMGNIPNSNQQGNVIGLKSNGPEM